MQLNLLPCYQVVYSDGAYFLCLWRGYQSQQQYKVQKITPEKPELVGNCLVFYDERASEASRKKYGLWWIDEDEGCCLCYEYTFNKWISHEGNFLCCSLYENEHPEEEKWVMLMPNEKKQTLREILLGRMICDKFMCFVHVNSKNEIILSSFPQGKLQQVKVDDYLIVAGKVWYRTGAEVFYSSEVSHLGGSKGWHFVKDSGGSKTWSSLKNEK